MQIANILLAVAGERGHTVPKYEVTPSEVAVLRLLHGDDAVTDIEVLDDIKRSHRAERDRLAEIFGRKSAEGRHTAPAVDALFPGAAASLFERFEELDIPEEFYKAEIRMKPTAKAPKTKAKKPEVEVAPVEDDADDGGEEMSDNDMFK